MSADITLLGITSALRPHKLAWLINRSTAWELVKVYGDVKQFLYTTENGAIRLIQNRMAAGAGSVKYLADDYKQVDFLLMIKDDTHTFDASKLCKLLKTIPGITHIANLDNVATSSWEWLEICYAS